MVGVGGTSFLIGPAMVGWMKRRPKPVVRVVGWISTRNSGLLPIPLPAQAAASAPRHPDDSSFGSRQTEADGDSLSRQYQTAQAEAKGVERT